MKPLDDRQPAHHRASDPLRLIDSQPHLFARQGAVRPTWRYSNGRRRGPYFELVWREQGRRRHLYLGREGPQVDKVRRVLESLQHPLRQARVLDSVRRQARASFRAHKFDLRRHLAGVGLYLKGNEIRGWRSKVALGGLAELLRTRIPAGAFPTLEPLCCDRVVRNAADLENRPFDSHIARLAKPPLSTGTAVSPPSHSPLALPPHPCHRPAEKENKTPAFNPLPRAPSQRNGASMAKRKSTPAKHSGKKTSPPEDQAAPRFTATQGQYLAYLYLYRKLHRQSPSESEVARYFRVSPPSVHQMIVKLEQEGLIVREPGVARSVRVAVPKDQIPELVDDQEQPPEAFQAVDRSEAGATNVYKLEVYLIGGPVPEKLGGKEISRTIEIRGDQTLEDLHHAIFEAYDRFDEHMYKFQFGKGPHDPKGKRYVLRTMLEAGDEPNLAGDVAETTIDSLKLKVDQPFGYWFDYGDDWWHQIGVADVGKLAPKVKYPRIVKRIGESPPQYSE